MIYCSNPFFQYLSYDKEIQKSIIRVLNSKQYVLGNEVSSFENEFAKFIGTKYSIGVANGTDAIEIGLRSLGIGNGDEVITVSHTANATVSAIESTGANPVLIDIEEDYFTINSDKISKAINKNTKAVIWPNQASLKALLTSVPVVSNMLAGNVDRLEQPSQA